MFEEGIIKTIYIFELFAISDDLFSILKGCTCSMFIDFYQTFYKRVVLFYHRIMHY